MGENGRIGSGMGGWTTRWEGGCNTGALASTGCDSAAQMELNGMAIGSSRAITSAWEIFSGYFEQR